VKTEEEIIADPSLQLVLSSQIANERAPSGLPVEFRADFYSVFF
jgi:hypothetical protein